MHQGQISGDGRWRWDGARWVPVGEALARPAAYPPTAIPLLAPTNNLAVVSLLIALVTLFFCPVVGGAVAVVTGHIARRQIRTRGELGGGIAMAALVIGYLHLAFWVTAISIFMFVGGLTLFETILSTTSH